MSARAIVVVLAVALSGCLGTETGNPPFAPSVAGASGGPMGIIPTPRIERGWLAIADVTLIEACASTEGVVVRHDPGALALAGAQRLETESVLDEGDYCGVRFDRVAWTRAEPSALRGHTLAIDAALPDGTPVRVRSALAGPLALAASEPFAMSPAAGGLVLFLNESLLFNGLRFDDAAREADGSILLSADTNRGLLDRVEAQLPGALSLYRDTDGDGELSDDEQRAGALAP